VCVCADLLYRVEGWCRGLVFEGMKCAMVESSPQSFAQPHIFSLSQIVQVALKKISRRYTNSSTFKRETDALLRIYDNGGHPNISGMRDMVSRQFFVFEYEQGLRVLTCLLTLISFVFHFSLLSVSRSSKLLFDTGSRHGG
jgi:hypothetical protein